MGNHFCKCNDSVIGRDMCINNTISSSMHKEDQGIKSI